MTAAAELRVEERTQFLDLDALRRTPLVREPFPHLILPEFVPAAVRGALAADFPQIDKPGSFPTGELRYGETFRRFLAALEGPEMRAVFAEKFGIDLTGRPTLVTVRGQARSTDGRIHTDTPSKLITVLIYMNEAWEAKGGRLRLLRSSDDLDDVVAEVPPAAGTLLAFRVTPNSWHGHEPVSGPRRVIQLNWVESENVARRERLRHGVSARLKRLLSFRR